MSGNNGNGFKLGDQVRLRHGESMRSGKTPEYRTWTGIIGRCMNPKNTRFEYYGGRGITVCQRWQGEGGFEAFLADMGRKPSPDYSIERRDNAKGYEPDNCKWATREEQGGNKRNNVNITIGSETRCVKAWADHYGVVSYKVAHQRIKAGWNPERAVSQPPMVPGLKAQG